MDLLNDLNHHLQRCLDCIVAGAEQTSIYQSQRVKKLQLLILKLEMQADYPAAQDETSLLKMEILELGKKLEEKKKTIALVYANVKMWEEKISQLQSQQHEVLYDYIRPKSPPCSKENFEDHLAHLNQYRPSLRQDAVRYDDDDDDDDCSMDI